MVEQSAASLDLVFHALSDGTRRALLHTIAQRRLSVGELAAPYAEIMSLAAVSKHLDVLERASLIQREREGKSRMVSLQAGPLAAAQDWLAFYTSFWNTRLDGLEAHFAGQVQTAGQPPKHFHSPKPRARKES